MFVPTRYELTRYMPVFISTGSEDLACLMARQFYLLLYITVSNNIDVGRYNK